MTGEVNYENSGVWRDTAREMRFMGMSYVGVFPLFIMLLKWNVFTMWFAIIVTTLLFVLERFDYTPQVVFRVVRSKIAGRRRPARNWNEYRKYADKPL